MSTPHNDKEWIDRAMALLDRSTEDLDAATLSRLTRARRAALAQRRTPSRRWVLGAGFAGAAAAVLFGVALGLHQRVDTSNRPAHDAVPLQAGDIDMLTGDDDALDLSENLDFYAWLDAQDGDKSG
jgi:uncharacterized protein DUF3619